MEFSTIIHKIIFIIIRSTFSPASLETSSVSVQIISGMIQCCGYINCMSLVKSPTFTEGLNSLQQNNNYSIYKTLKHIVF